MNKKILIIGGSSGIGMSLIKKLLINNQLHVSYNKNKINIENKNLKILKLDLGNLNNIKNFVLKLNKIKFDIVLFISAVTPNKLNNNKSNFRNLYKNYFDKFININCYANLFLFEKLYKKKVFKKNATIIFFSSIAGSIELRGKFKHNKPGGNLFYRISKAALNCVVKNLAYDLKKKLNIIAFHPGYINLGSGKKNATLNSSDVINKISRIIFLIKKKDNGNFLDFDKKRLKW